MWPLHTWLPDAHTAAPTVGSVLLAGRAAEDGHLRPDPDRGADRARRAPHALAPFLGALAVVGIVYGSLACLAQRDLKRLIAYSSVGHMGFVLLGIATLTPVGINGALFANIAHGLITGLLFFLVGAIKDRHAHRRPRPSSAAGSTRGCPGSAGCSRFAAVASLGLPGLAGFWGEMLTLLGAFDPAPALHRGYYLRADGPGRRRRGAHRRRTSLLVRPPGRPGHDVPRLERRPCCCATSTAARAGWPGSPLVALVVAARAAGPAAAARRSPTRSCAGVLGGGLMPASVAADRLASPSRPPAGRPAGARRCSCSTPSCPTARRQVTGWLAAVGCWSARSACWSRWSATVARDLLRARPRGRRCPSCSYVVDDLTLAFQALVLAGAAVVVLLSLDTVRDSAAARRGSTASCCSPRWPAR